MPASTSDSMPDFGVGNFRVPAPEALGVGWDGFFLGFRGLGVHVGFGV